MSLIFIVFEFSPLFRQEEMFTFACCIVIVILCCIVIIFLCCIVKKHVLPKKVQENTKYPETEGL